MKEENKYRPMPFWSWNDEIEEAMTGRQIQAMEEQGIGGFVIHARGGLKTDYMEEKWFRAVDRAVSEADSRGMMVWIYDENGWPSGFGDGKINGRGILYQQKYLRMERGERQTPQTILNTGGYHFYYETNPFYVDTLDKTVVKAFLKEIYEPYYVRYGEKIQGFFTDEPQISRNGIPWSFCMEEAYRQEYGQELLPRLRELFVNEGEYKTTRMNFWRLVTKLFSRSYAKQIGDWCRERGLKLTGHLVLEETLLSQLTTNGACMPSYQFFDIPGVDWLGGEKRDLLSNANMPLTFKQAESVAHQFGKKQVLTESFAASGHDISFSEMRGLLEWQMVRGITSICPHLQGYSVRGIRKRDFPPAMFWQQPWWENYKKQNDYLTMTGRMLSDGMPVYNTLLIHNESSAWVSFRPDQDAEEDVMRYQASIEKAIENLEQKHILFHLGDELIMEENAFVRGKELVIGKQNYSTVVLPKHCVLFASTEKLLREFRHNGGKIVLAENIQAEIEENPVIDNKEILYTARKCGNGVIHYYVNATSGEQTAGSIKGDMYLDPDEGVWKKFNGRYIFHVNDSLVTLERTEETAEELLEVIKTQVGTMTVPEVWKIAECSENVLLMDKCDYYFDNELQEKDGYVLNILERACRLKRKVKIDMYFYAEIRCMPKQLFLAGEDWNQYLIEVNGSAIQYKDAGEFIDPGIRKIDILPYMHIGKNVVHLQMEFAQTEEFYESLEKAYQFESERNKLTYPEEIEAIYLTGDFGVFFDQTEECGRHWRRMQGGCYLDKMPEKITLQNIEEQGFAFFAGILKLRAEETELPKEIQLSMQGIQTVEVYADEEKKGCVIWNNEKIGISVSGVQTKGVLSLILRNNLRNLWGPHHYDGQTHITVWPSYFYKEPCLQGNLGEEWNDDYVIRKLSVEIKGLL